MIISLCDMVWRVSMVYPANNDMGALLIPSLRSQPSVQSAVFLYTDQLIIAITICSVGLRAAWRAVGLRARTV